MADTEVGNPIGFVDKRRDRKGQELGATGKLIAANTTTIATNVASVGALRARLAAINGTYYTATRLNAMTKNDMVYALRQTDELGNASNGSI